MKTNTIKITNNKMKEIYMYETDNKCRANYICDILNKYDIHKLYEIIDNKYRITVEYDEKYKDILKMLYIIEPNKEEELNNSIYYLVCTAKCITNDGIVKENDIIYKNIKMMDVTLYTRYDAFYYGFENIGLSLEYNSNKDGKYIHNGFTINKFKCKGNEIERYGNPEYIFLNINQTFY